MSSQRPFFSRKRVLLPLGFFLLLLSLILLREPIMKGMGQALLSDETLEQEADGIIILMGQLTPRADRAVELFKEHRAPKIYLSRPDNDMLADYGLVKNESDITRSYLEKKGIPPQSLVIVESPQNTSTFDEAVTYREYFTVQNPRPQHLILVTSWSHTARAKWIFKKVFKESGIQLSMVAAYPTNHGPDSWWKNESGFLSVYNEYLKWGYYLVNYGFRDLSQAKRAQ